MRASLEKYLCLEDSCQGLPGMRWTCFLKHQRVEHFRNFILHFQKFSSIVDFQVWFKFIQEAILKLPVVKEDGDTLLCACEAGVRSRCPARMFTITKSTTNHISIGVIVMGEHYGHEHSPSRMERLFLLDYNVLDTTPIDQWHLYFKHAGVFLLNPSSPTLRMSTLPMMTSNFKHPISVGFMTVRQMAILKEFQVTLFLEEHGNWIALYSLVEELLKPSEPPIALPIAYCYSSCMDQAVVTEFFHQLKIRAGYINCIQVLTNNVELFESPWSEAFVDNECPFLLSWQTVVTEIPFLITAPLNYYEEKELGEILKKSICDKFPYVVNIINDFLTGVRMSKKLRRVVILNLLRVEHHDFLSGLIAAWIGELQDHKWVEVLQERMFMIESFYVTEAIISVGGSLPKIIMDLMLYSNHVHNTSPSLKQLTDLYFTTSALNTSM